jgi:hypothetical protein
VDAVNDAPLAASDTFYGDEDTWVEANVSVNDEDIDSSELIFSVLTENNPYNISLDASGMMQWLPPTNFNGAASFQYSVCDNAGACDTATVIIEILEINDAPLVDFAPATVQEDMQTDYAALSYAFDIEGQGLYQSIVTASGVEALLNPLEGTITLTASDNYYGNAFVVLTTCDILGDCFTDTIHIEITPVNDDPYAFDTSFNTFQNIDFTESWYNHIFDIDNVELSFEGAAHFGNLEISSDGSFVFSPLENFLGQDTLFVHACDTSNACIDLYYIVNVLPPNQPPVIQSAEAEICQGTSASFDLSQIVSDEIDAAGYLQYAFSSNVPSTFTTDAENQALTIEPSPLFHGQMIIEMQVCDNASPSLCATNTLTLQITGTTSPVINEVVVNSISCNSAADGSIQLVDVTEEIGVTYLWSNGNTSEAIDELGPGDYSVQISGLSNCSEPLSAQFTITEPEELLVTLNNQSISSPGAGSIESTVAGGTAPYSYLWSGPNGFSATGSSIAGLNEPGDFSLTVTDANGCVYSTVSSITSTDVISGSSFNVYPNPASGNFIILEMNALVETGSTLVVIDACGRVIMSKSVSSKKEVLSVDNWEAGIYTICVEGLHYKYQTRVIVLN